MVYINKHHACIKFILPFEVVKSRIEIEVHNHENNAIYCCYWLIYHYDNIIIISSNRVTNYLLINLFNNNEFMY